MRIAPGAAAWGAGVPAARAMALFTTARVSRSITGATSGAYRSGATSAKSATARRYQLPDRGQAPKSPDTTIEPSASIRGVPLMTVGWDINGTVILGWHEP